MLDLDKQLDPIGSGKFSILVTFKKVRDYFIMITMETMEQPWEIITFVYSMRKNKWTAVSTVYVPYDKLRGPYYHTVICDDANKLPITFPPDARSILDMYEILGFMPRSDKREIYTWDKERAVQQHLKCIEELAKEE